MLVMKQGSIIAYPDLCAKETVTLQRGMNLRLRGGYSLILVDTGIGAPYRERIEEDGKVLVYGGHDIPQRRGGKNPKTADQLGCNADGSLTRNGMFFEAAEKYARGKSPPEPVRVFDEITDGIWASNGLFTLCAAWREADQQRRVFKFKLCAADYHDGGAKARSVLIPTAVKKKVWTRDEGRCVKCGAGTDLHFELIAPRNTHPGSAFVVKNIHLLCGQHG